MKRTSVIAFLLLVLCSSTLVGCGNPSAKLGKIAISVSVPSGPSVYPEIPFTGFQTQGKSTSTREIPAGTNWIDVIIANVITGYRASGKITIDPGVTNYNTSISVPAGSGYVVEVIAGASGTAPVDISLVFGRATNVNVMAGSSTNVDLELKRMVFTVTTPPPTSVTSGGTVSMTGTLTLPVQMDTKDIQIMAKFINNDLSYDSDNMDLASQTTPSFEPGAPQPLTLVGVAPSLPANADFACNFVIVMYASPYEDPSLYPTPGGYVLVAQAQGSPFATTHIQAGGTGSSIGISIH